MGFSRHFLKDNRFMYIKIVGEINDQNLKEHIIEHNKETDGIVDIRELVDGRMVESVRTLTVQCIIDCALLSQKRPKGLLALLVSDSTLHYGLARIFETFTDSRRKGLKIFKEFEAALDWLANSEEELGILAKFIEKS